MTLLGWLQIGVLAALVTAAVKPLGAYIARAVAGGGRFTLLEHGIYRLAGVDPTKEQSWVRYTLAVLWFHLIGIAALYGLQRSKRSTAQSARARRRCTRPGTEHGSQLYDKYKLAVLWWRDDTQLLVADGRDHRPIVPLRRHRHCRRHCARPRVRSQIFVYHR